METLALRHMRDAFKLPLRKKLSILMRVYWHKLGGGRRRKRRKYIPPCQTVRESLDYRQRLDHRRWLKRMGKAYKW